MPDYSYTTGDGLSALDVTKPDGDVEPVANLDDAIKQIIAYLKDSAVGPHALIQSIYPVGTILMTAGNTAPAGWLMCDGAAYPRTTYAELFTKIGTIYGSGDNSTTFNVPNFSGRSPVGTGVSSLSGATTRTLGEQVGNQLISLKIDQLPEHNHTLSFGLEDGAGGSQLRMMYDADAGQMGSSSRTTASTGANANIDITPPLLAVNFIIKF